VTLLQATCLRSCCNFVDGAHCARRELREPYGRISISSHNVCIWFACRRAIQKPWCRFSIGAIAIVQSSQHVSNLVCNCLRRIHRRFTKKVLVHSDAVCRITNLPHVCDTGGIWADFGSGCSSGCGFGGRCEVMAGDELSGVSRKITVLTPPLCDLRQVKYIVHVRIAVDTRSLRAIACNRRTGGRKSIRRSGAIERGPTPELKEDCRAEGGCLVEGGCHMKNSECAVAGRSIHFVPVGIGDQRYLDDLHV